MADQNDGSSSDEEDYNYFDEFAEMPGEDSNSSTEDGPADIDVSYDRPANIDVSYDQSLPRQHSYLGTDLEELSGRTLLEENECLELAILSFLGVVLIPGQILPLKIGHPSTVAMLKDVISKDRTFGIVVKVANNDQRTQSLASVGTTAEVRYFKEVQEAASGLSYLCIKAEGRQRFCLEGTPRKRVDGVLVSQVRILPETHLSDPGVGVRPWIYQKFQLVPPSKSSSGANALKKYKKYQFADVTRWPSWVYEQYDAEILLKKIKEELLSWTSSVSIESMPKDPVEFSFWVASNLPLDDSLKVMLLTRNCMVQRLRCEMSILERYQMLYCKECGRPIAHKEDLFSLSLVGPQGTYVNPGGYVHETITVLRAKNVQDVTHANKEHSWFPGYAWSVVNCKECHSHMGWRFSTTDKRFKPQVFWGLCRPALLPGILPDQEKWEPCW